LAGIEGRTDRVKALQRLDTTLTVALVVVGLGALAFTCTNVTLFAIDHGTPSVIAWLLDPVASIALVAILTTDGTLIRHGATDRASGAATFLRLFAGLSTWVMNVWQSVWPDGGFGVPTHPDPAGIVLHSVPPLLLIGLAEAATVYRRRIAELLADASREVADSVHTATAGALTGTLPASGANPLPGAAATPLPALGSGPLPGRASAPLTASGQTGFDQHGKRPEGTAGSASGSGAASTREAGPSRRREASGEAASRTRREAPGKRPASAGGKRPGTRTADTGERTEEELVSAAVGLLVERRGHLPYREAPALLGVRYDRARAVVDDARARLAEAGHDFA
jgi:hypothetical protein